MTTIVLIFYLTLPASSNGRMTLVSAEFTSRERCEAAGAAASKAFTSWITTARWVCVEK